MTSFTSASRTRTRFFGRPAPSRRLDTPVLGEQLIEAEQIDTAVGHRLRLQRCEGRRHRRTPPRLQPREPRAELSSTPSAAAIHPSRGAKLTITGYDHNSLVHAGTTSSSCGRLFTACAPSSVTITMT